jgi:CheY-like chemotaxis protein
VLLVDDSRDLLDFMERLMTDTGWNLLTADSATEARRLMSEHRPNVAILDYMLPDGNGVELGIELAQVLPNMIVIIMTGTVLPPEEDPLCTENDFPLLRKPFLLSDVMAQIQTALTAGPVHRRLDTLGSATRAILEASIPAKQQELVIKSPDHFVVTIKQEDQSGVKGFLLNIINERLDTIGQYKLVILKAQSFDSRHNDYRENRTFLHFSGAVPVLIEPSCTGQSIWLIMKPISEKH